MKRNDLKNSAKGDILVTMDDDDYYFSSYIEHAVDILTKSPKIGLAALKEAYIFYPMHWTISISGPWLRNWPGASYVYTKKYAMSHQYDNNAVSGEEWSFTEDFTSEILELDKDKTMIVLSHNTNTSNKNNLIKLTKCDIPINNLITSNIDINFYQSLSKFILNKGPAILKINNNTTNPFWAK